MPTRPASGLLTVAGFETDSILRDRRFLLGLVLQVLLLACLVPALIGYAEHVSRGGDVLASRAKSFAPVGIWGQEGSILEALLRGMERLRIQHVESEEEARAGLALGRFCMVVGVPSPGESAIVAIANDADPRSVSATASLELVRQVYQTLHIKSFVEEVLRRDLAGMNLSEEEAGERAKFIAEAYLSPVRLEVVTIDSPFLTTETLGLEPNLTTSAPSGETGAGQDANEVGSSLDEGRFLSLVFLAFGLFFPLLTGSGIVIESVTGEKERRTLEALLGSSASRAGILLGKFFSGLLVSSVQALGLLVLLGLSIRIQNLPGVALCMLITCLAVLSAATLVSAVCMGTKEVNLAGTVLYVLIFVTFLGPVVVPGPIARISPLTPLVRLAAGDMVQWASAAAPLLGWAGFSLASLIASLRFFGRDDFLFGPRPSFRQLVGSWVRARTESFRSQALFVAGMGAFATLPAIVFPSLFLLPSIAIFGRFGFFLALVFAGLVEEYFKPYGVYVLPANLTRGRLAMLGALSGFSFSCVENVLLTFALLGSRAIGGWLVSVRYIVAPAVHMGLSTVVVLGHSRGRATKLLALAAASFTHALYNLLALLVVK